MATRHALRSVLVSLVLAMTASSCAPRPTPPPPTGATAAPTPVGAPRAIDPAHTALLVMDLQQAIVAMGGDEVQSTVTHTADVERESREAGVRVVFVETGFTPGYPELKSNDKSFAKIAGTGRLLEGTPDTRLDPRIAPVGREPVIFKHQVGAFSAPQLQPLLRADGIDTLVLAGLATSGVVLATAEAAADLDYRVIVVSDCVGDPDPTVNRILLDKVLPTQADVRDSAQYLRALHP